MGCGICVNNCSGATQISSAGKAEIVDQEKLEKCGGESVCPMGAIEKILNEGNVEQSKTPFSPSSSPTPFSYEPSPDRGRGLGMERGRGMGAGRGRGLGRGPRDGRGGGRGGGGRER